MTAVAVAYLGVVLWLTLGPAPWAASDLAEVPLGVLNPATWLSATTWTSGAPIEFVLNVVLFVPVGVLAARLARGRARIVLPVVLTLLIEVAQIPLAERVSDPRDLVANVLGALAGLLLARGLTTPGITSRPSSSATAPAVR